MSVRRCAPHSRAFSAPWGQGDCLRDLETDSVTSLAFGNSWEWEGVCLIQPLHPLPFLMTLQGWVPLTAAARLSWALWSHATARHKRLPVPVFLGTCPRDTRGGLGCRPFHCGAQVLLSQVTPCSGQLLQNPRVKTRCFCPGHLSLRPDLSPGTATWPPGCARVAGPLQTPWGEGGLSWGHGTSRS